MEMLQGQVASRRTRSPALRTSFGPVPPEHPKVLRGRREAAPYPRSCLRHLPAQPPWHTGEGSQPQPPRCQAVVAGLPPSSRGSACSHPLPSPPLLPQLVTQQSPSSFRAGLLRVRLGDRVPSRKDDCGRPTVEGEPGARAHWEGWLCRPGLAWNAAPCLLQPLEHQPSRLLLSTSQARPALGRTLGDCQASSPTGDHLRWNRPPLFPSTLPVGEPLSPGPG